MKAELARVGGALPSRETIDSVGKLRDIERCH